ncbi:crotonase/enoyl-CoA hydratase family protein [Nocardioides caeni]|uniref:Crotonase/enoyl-CoA hydratase family protein n=1 Tax=Nocardioides caeni TaxID=574700 RepID=A0A4S8N096_9ACTN|nr:crotonase/enoyl-CoA hydratase family protein [Nocardioides caeni]THV08871.1 crotonase/enoyl-CoA hydratase family protein [Nocardioides caeni]
MASSSPTSRALRNLRNLRSLRLLAPVVAQTARVAASDAVARLRPRTPGAEAELTLPAPAGAADFARHVHVQGVVPGSPGQVAELVADLDRVHEWLTLHLSWRGERPSRMEAGAEFVQQIKLMDIPAQARWRVERADAEGFELRGTGPMGITVGLWCTLAATSGATSVRLDGALDGPPVRGPIGLTAVRSVETALAESLQVLAGILGGGSLARIAEEPVRHERTGRLLDPTTPVVIGVGQLVQRDPDPAAPVEPAAMAARALRAAAEDAGLGDDLLGRADLVYAVPSASWTYGDQAGLVAELVGAPDAGTVQTSPYGGDGAQLAVNDAAREVAEGRAHVVLVSGAEAGRTVAALQAAGREPQWTRQPGDAAPDRVIGIDRTANNEAETSVGLGAPIYVYALLESALRGAAGTPDAEHRDRIADLWARHSAIAAGNPWAWDRTERSAAEIATPSPDNREIADPYTKLMCANLQVDLAAGVIVASVAAAQALGVPQERWVFLHAGASAADEWFVSERADLTASPAIAAAGAAALDHAGITVDELGPIDLYSCFPAAVQLGAGALGLPWNDPARPLSVTGGLTSAGGPGNNYGLHAVASMVPLLRAEPEQFGLSSSLGWYATKHAVGVYSATPPRQTFAHLKPAFDRPAPRPVRTDLEGTAVVEAVTVPRGRSGDPEGVIVSAIAPDGARVLLRREDPADVLALIEGDSLRRTIALVDGRVVLTGERQELPEPPPAPVRTERAGGEILVVTLDRPRVRNAIDGLTARLLERAIDDAEADDTVRVIVLTGAGGTFCAGMDLVGAHGGAVPVTDRRGPLGLTAEPPTKPTIAAVEGSALAGGFELALCADLIVAAEDATFGLPEAKRGLLAAAGGLWRTAVRLPRAVALELAMVGDAVTADRLHGLGLVNAVVPTGTALPAALELAERIVANAPLSVLVGKQVVDEAPTWTPEEAFARQSELASPVLLSDDAREGVAAFAEKRSPRWTGR